MGTVSLVDDTAAGSIPYTGLIRFRPNDANVDMEYVRFFLGSKLFSDQVDLVKTGVAIQHFGPTHLGGVLIPVPPPTVQTEIAEDLREMSRHINELVGDIERQIALMIEHRQVLVTAAVTGQLDIPGLAA